MIFSLSYLFRFFFSFLCQTKQVKQPHQIYFHYFLLFHFNTRSGGFCLLAHTLMYALLTVACNWNTTPGFHLNLLASTFVAIYIANTFHCINTLATNTWRNSISTNEVIYARNKQVIHHLWTIVVIWCWICCDWWLWLWSCHCKNKYN